MPSRSFRRGALGSCWGLLLAAPLRAASPAPPASTEPPGGTSAAACDDWGTNARGQGEPATSCQDPGQVLQTVFDDLAPRTLLEPRPQLFYSHDRASVWVRCNGDVPEVANGPAEAQAVMCGPAQLRTGAVGIGRSIFRIAGECVIDGEGVSKEQTLGFVVAHELMHLVGDHNARFERHMKEHCDRWLDSTEGRRERERIERGFPPNMRPGDRRAELHLQLVGKCLKRSKGEFLAFARSLETEADVEAFNLLDVIGSRHYSRRAGECLMRKLVDYEWQLSWGARTPPAEEQRGDHPLTRRRVEIQHALARMMDEADAEASRPEASP